MQLFTKAPHDGVCACAGHVDPKNFLILPTCGKPVGGKHPDYSFQEEEKSSFSLAVRRVCVCVLSRAKSKQALVTRRNVTLTTVLMFIMLSTPTEEFVTKTSHSLH